MSEIYRQDDHINQEPNVVMSTAAIMYATPLNVILPRLLLINKQGFINDATYLASWIRP